MRTVTFSDSETNRLINRTFVASWYNQASDLFPGKPASPVDQQPAVSEDYLRQFPDGGGGPNVKIFFCTPEGKIVHFIQGYYRPKTFREEARFALDLLALAGGRAGDPDAATALQMRHQERRAELEAELRRVTTEPPPAVEAARIRLNQRAQPLRIRMANSDLALKRLYQDPKPFMVNEVHAVA